MVSGMEEIIVCGETTYQWSIGDSTFQAWPTRGAMLMSWDKPGRPIIHWPGVSGPEDVTRARGGNPILFPFSARTFHDGEIGKWKDFTGQVRPMPMHGVARQGSFELVEIDAGGFAAQLVAGESALEIYPYDYEFTVRYRFGEDEMRVDFSLKNLGDHSIPWSAGHHFYFRLPWLDGTNRNDYEIDLPARVACYHESDGSLRDTEFSTPVRMSEPALVDRIHYSLEGSGVECRCLADGSSLGIRFVDDPPHSDFAMVTWTETDESPFFCIEPWMGPPNSPETGVGLHLVEPGSEEDFSVVVEVSG